MNLFERLGFNAPQASSTARPIGQDELGRTIYRDSTGATYAMGQQPVQRTDAQRNDQALIDAGIFPPDPTDPRAAVNALATSLLSGFTAPGNALRGQPVTLGDVWETAGTAALGSQAMPAPANALRSGGMRSVDPIATRGAQIMDMLKAGRGADVTDAMLDMGDPVQNARLNEWLYSNYDLPMDAGSRAERASGMDTDAFHATRSDVPFQSFRPGARGSTYMASTPQGAEAGAAGQALENYGSDGVKATMPLRVNSNDIEGLTVNRAAYDALPEKITDEATIKAVADDVRRAGLPYWDDAYEAVRFGDEYRYYKRDAPTVRYQDLEAGRNAFGYRLPAYNSGSDAESLARSASRGKQAFLVSDEGGSSIVASPEMPIRSRFARFDPRLAHLRNLSAGAAGAAVLGAQGEDPQAEVINYLRSIGAM